MRTASLSRSKETAGRQEGTCPCNPWCQRAMALFKVDGGNENQTVDSHKLHTRPLPHPQRRVREGALESAGDFGDRWRDRSQALFVLLSPLSRPSPGSPFVGMELSSIDPPATTWFTVDRAVLSPEDYSYHNRTCRTDGDGDGNWRSSGLGVLGLWSTLSGRHLEQYQSTNFVGV